MILPLGIYPKNLKTEQLYQHLLVEVEGSLICNRQSEESAKMNGRANWYPHNGILLTRNGRVGAG